MHPRDRSDVEPTEPSFDEFVAARWTALVRTAHLLTGTPEAGADLVQEVLARAYPRWARIARAEAPEAYVRRMLLNAFIDARRVGARRARQDRLLRVAAEPSYEVDPGERVDLWRLLATLSPRERAVLVLRYYEDLTEAQIAETLGIATGSVKSYAHTALRRLRHHEQHLTRTEETP